MTQGKVDMMKPEIKTYNMERLHSYWKLEAQDRNKYKYLRVPSPSPAVGIYTDDDDDFQWHYLKTRK